MLSRVGIDDVQVGVPGAAVLGRSGGRRGPGDQRAVRRGADVEPVRPQRPGDRRPALLLQAGVAGGAAGLRRARSSPPTRTRRSRSAATSTSRRPTTTSGASSTTGTPPTSPRRSGRRSTTLVDAGFTDVVRPHTPGPGVYTYWDYTQLSFQKRRGMRIDFALASPALAARVTGAFDRPRGAQGQGRLRPRAGHRGAEDRTDDAVTESGSWCSSTTRPTRCCGSATG